MTTDLREGLAGLAARQSTGSPPPDLWHRGTRRRRRVRLASAAATVLAATLAVLAATVGLDSVRPAEPMPAQTEAQAAIPDRLYTPDPELPGTHDQPPGRLAVVAGAERRTGWWRMTTTNGVVGVSAGTGAYRFLDLPGAREDGAGGGFDAPPAISPGGRLVAYWLRHPDNAGWVGGYAVYDTVTGEVLRRPVSSDLGLVPEVLSWADDDAVVAQFSVVTSRSSGGFSGEVRPAEVWEPGPDRLTVVTRPRLWVESVSPLDDGFAMVTSRGLELRDQVEARPDRTLRLGGDRNAVDASVARSGDTVVTKPQPSTGMTRRLFVGAIGDRPDVRLRPLPLDVFVLDLLGWQDAEHVVVRGVRAPGQQRADVYAIDVRTGGEEVLVHEDRVSWGSRPDYATTLWSRPPATRPAPPDVLDRRWGAAAALVLALAGGAGWRRWRRARA